MTAFLIMLLVACAAAELYSLRHSLDGIEYDCRLSKTLAEPDETIELISILTNRKRRFVPFLRWTENVPAVMNTAGELGTLSATERRGSLRASGYLMPRQRLTRRTPFSISRRGRYLFWGATLSGGDFLGMSERSRQAELFRELVILPKPLSAGTLDALPGGLLGDQSVNRFIHEDPMLTLGFREYTGREPMKQISWTQSARMGSLMVKNLDHTVERSATVVLNVDTPAFGTYGDELIEACFSIARSVCEELEDLRVPYAFLSNARSSNGSQSGEAGDGLGAAHIKPILEGLGRAVCERSATAWSLIDRAAALTDAGRLHILITPTRRDLDSAGMERLELRSGLKVRVLVAEEVAAK